MWDEPEIDNIIVWNVIIILQIYIIYIHKLYYSSYQRTLSEISCLQTKQALINKLFRKVFLSFHDKQLHAVLRMIEGL